MWKEHFKNLLGNSPKITDKPIKKIINNQQDIKLGQFAPELDIVLTKIKNRKAVGLDEISPEVWKTRKFDNLLLRYCNAVYNQNTIERWAKRLHPPYPKKVDLGISKNYWGFTFTSIEANIYNALLLNFIMKILWKNQNSFWRNRSTISRILTIHWILEGIRAKSHEVTLLFVDFSKAFDFILREMEHILLAYGHPKETVAAIIMLNKTQT